MIKINKSFKSEIDNFLENFDREYPQRSLSQQEEAKKYAQISVLGGFVVAQSKTLKTPS